jgi:hypothetical protein
MGVHIKVSREEESSSRRGIDSGIFERGEGQGGIV